MTEIWEKYRVLWGHDVVSQHDIVSQYDVVSQFDLLGQRRESRESWTSKSRKNAEECSRERTESIHKKEQCYAPENLQGAGEMAL